MQLGYDTEHLVQCKKLSHITAWSIKTKYLKYDSNAKHDKWIHFWSTKVNHTSLFWVNYGMPYCDYFGE